MSIKGNFQIMYILVFVFAQTSLSEINANLKNLAHVS